jgi:cytochrome c-type biogenesis protein CcmH/NrfF
MLNKLPRITKSFVGRGFSRDINAHSFSGVLTPEGSRTRVRVPTRRRRLALIFAAIAGMASAMLPFHVDAQKTERAKVVGEKLMCMCGCGQILTQCNHINCPSSAPMLKELDQHVASGEADDLIVQDFIQEYGEKVLSAPPSTGFNSIAWYIPGVAFALGLGIVLAIIRMWRQRDVHRLASASATPAPPATLASEVRNLQLERARRQADKETEE